MDTTFELRVRDRAHHLWLRDGGRGHVDRHWFQAVRDTLAATLDQPAGAAVASQNCKCPASAPSARDERPTRDRSAAMAVI